MTNQENKIPIKGYATFDPLKHCWIGTSFKPEWFADLPIYKNDKIMDPLKRIAEETQQDYEKLDSILKDAGVQTYRSNLDIDKVQSLKNIYRPPINPRDHFAVVGEKLYAVNSGFKGYADVLKRIDRKNLEICHTPGAISTAVICRVGKDIYWDIAPTVPKNIVDKYANIWREEGFRVHLSNRGYHSDGSFCVVKPGCIISLYDIQDYATEFPGWEVLYLEGPDMDKINEFVDMKVKVGGRWWLKGEEHNDQLIQFVNTYLNGWVGYVEETVFDVNMLSIDQNTVIVNSHNKEIADYFKKHKVEPIVFNFRHRYFWDGGIHCITQDLYREGTMEDYFG